MKQVVGVNIQNDFRGGEGFGDKDYHFFSLDDVEIGDLVVIDTRNGYRIGKVCRILGINESNYANKNIVQKIDLDSYQEKIERENKLESIKAKFENKINKHNQLKQFEELALESGDPELKGLLYEYKETLKELGK